MSRTKSHKMQVNIFINSPSYQFTVSFENDEFTVCGNHWFRDELEVYETRLNTSEDVLRVVRQYIETWCCLTTVTFNKTMDNCILDFHQSFKSLDDRVGDKGTSFTWTIDLLRNFRFPSA